jgi:hypothetical protein
MMGYHVTLACDLFNPTDIERTYGLGAVMEKCDHVRIPEFRPIHESLFALRRLQYARQVLPMFSDTDADIVFSTQSSPCIIPQRIFHFVYDINNLFQYPPMAASPELGGTSRQSHTGPRDLLVSGFKRLGREALARYARLIWRKVF